MIPLHHDSHYMFRFADDRIIPRFHLDGVGTGRQVDVFNSHWAKSLGDPANIVLAILFEEAMVGYISCFPMGGQDHVGYWIDRTCWGKGIASRALHLLLREVATRPMVATVAKSNGASLRVLQKCGFVVEVVRHSPATDRYTECEEAVLVLR